MLLWHLKISTRNLLRLLSVADVDAKKSVDIKCRFASWYLGLKANFLFRLWAQGLVKILSWGEILKLKLYQYFTADIWVLERKFAKMIYNFSAYLEETENFTENAYVSIEAHLVTNVMWDLGEDAMCYFMDFTHPSAEMVLFSLEFDRSDPSSQMTRMPD